MKGDYEKHGLCRVDVYVIVMVTYLSLCACHRDFLFYKKF